MSTLMDFTLPPKGLGLVDSLNPVETDHPINQGLVNWWLAHPGLFGGTKLWDLCNRSHNTLTSSPLWVYRGNWFGSLAFNGSSQYAESPVVVTAYPITLSCWFRSTDITVTQTLMSVMANTGTKANGVALQAAGAVVGDPIRAAVFNGGQIGGANTDTTTGYTADIWYHACAVFAGTASRTSYINAGSATTNTFSVLLPTVNVNMIGAKRSGTTVDVFANADIMDARIYSRALTSSEVSALYLQSLQGHPDTLRRYPERSWFILRDLDDTVTPGAAPTFNASWAKANTFMGAF